MKVNNYEQVARYYDLLHAQFAEDIGFVQSVAQAAGAEVLELGCGTIRMAIPLAKAGHRVIGLDNSPAMLAIARRKREMLPEQDARRRLHLIQGDMRAIPAGGAAFNLIVATHNTFMHLAPNDALAALRSARRVLAVQGRLLLDLANPLLIAQMPTYSAPAREHVLEDAETGETVEVSTSITLDDRAQILRVEWMYDVAQTGGPIVRTAAYATDYHYQFPHEMAPMLRGAGLSLKGQFGDYDGSPFAEYSPRWIIVAGHQSN